MNQYAQLRTAYRRYSPAHSMIFCGALVLVLFTLILNRPSQAACADGEDCSPLPSLEKIAFWRPSSSSKPAASSSTKAQCPNPLFSVGQVDRPLDPATQTCTPVQSASTDFDVEVCRSSAAPACNQFSVRITRVDGAACAAAEQAGPRVKSVGLDDVLRAQGPDSFLLRTNGAQRWVSEKAVYEGDCTYRFDISLNNGGAVWLELWWNYGDYQYMNELDWDKWPPCHFQTLTSVPIKLDICPAVCPTHHAPRLRDTETVLSLEGSSATQELPPSLYGRLDPSNLPACPLEGLQQGSWLPLHPMDHVSPPVAFQGPSRGEQPLFTGYRYVPYQCQYRHAGTAFADHAACRQNKRKVIFYGDSHTRYTMVGFLYRMDGHIEPYPDNDHGVRYNAHVLESQTYKFDQLTIDWIPDHDESKIKHLSDEYIAEHQGVVVSTGAWNAMSGWSLDDYIIYLTRVLDRFSAVESKVYMVPAPFPPQTSGVPVERHEHRTNWQLDQYRNAAVRLALAKGWRVVDQYERGMPVVLEMLAADALHLSPGAAQESIIDEVLAKLEVC